MNEPDEYVLSIDGVMAITPKSPTDRRGDASPSSTSAPLRVVKSTDAAAAMCGAIDLGGSPLLEALPAAVYVTDTAGRLTFYNQVAADLWGCQPEPGDQAWCASWRLSSADGFLPHAHEIGGQSQSITEATATWPDGAQGVFIYHRANVQDATGQIVGGMNMLVDITARKAAEERNHFLAREGDHRNANLLATVQAVARMTRAETVPAYVEAFTGRISSLARVHSLLVESRWSGANLKQLAEDELAPYRAERADRVKISGADIHLTAEVGQALAMILHELTTNATKYGALSVDTGTMDVSWEQTAGGGLCLRWIEKGVRGVSTPSRKGFGSRLIEHSVESQLGGKAHFKWMPSGLACTIVMPPEKLSPRS